MLAPRFFLSVFNWAVFNLGRVQFGEFMKVHFVQPRMARQVGELVGMYDNDTVWIRVGVALKAVRIAHVDPTDEFMGWLSHKGTARPETK